MSLRILTRPTWRHTVTATAPTESGPVEEEFSVRYRLSSIPPADLDPRQDQEAFLRDIVAEVEDMVDDEGQPLPWSEEAWEKVLALPWARLAIVRGYFESVTGARAKN